MLKTSGDSNLIHKKKKEREKKIQRIASHLKIQQKQ